MYQVIVYSHAFKLSCSQGSVPGPFFFFMCILPLSTIIVARSVTHYSLNDNIY